MLQRSFSIANLLRSSHRLEARGKLGERSPYAIIDIGSNSVRLVVYDGLTRAPAILFNEKVHCELGRGVARTGELSQKSVERALAAIKRFASVTSQLETVGMGILATAAVREASNGPAFVEEVERITQSKVLILSGRQEAYYAAMGVESGFFRPEGIVADMGGGSMELTGISAADGIARENGTTLPLGALRVMSDSQEDPRAARKLVRERLRGLSLTWPGEERTLYAVGGTWRALARVHMLRIGYPLDSLHHYRIPSDIFLAFCNEVVRGSALIDRTLDQISKTRRALLPYGAVVMTETIKALDVEEVVISAFGLREGYMYSLLDDQTKEQDPLLEATAELSVIRARSPGHSQDLSAWTDMAFKTLELHETHEQQRYRHAACNLADISWRLSSDFRAEQTIGIINNVGLSSITHEGRAYLAIVNFHRHQGLGSKNVPPEMAILASEEFHRRARVLSGFFRILYLFSASVEGILPQIGFEKRAEEEFSFVLPERLADLIGERINSRLEQLSRELGLGLLLEVS